MTQTSDFDFSGYKGINLAPGVAATDAMNLGQLQQFQGTLAASGSIGSGKGAELVGFANTGTDAIARNLLAKAQESYSALDVIPSSEHQAIAQGTSTLDVADLIAQASSNSPDVLLPPGRYFIANRILLGPGQRLRGAGKHKTVLYVPSTFATSANGVIEFGGGGPGPIIEDLTIRFEQPDTKARDNMTRYPPAIYAQSTPRFAIRRCRVEQAWDGIDMKGNSGGATIDDFEISSYNTDIDIDGSQDSIKISKLHIWPFGMTADQFHAFTDPNHTGIKSGRCDDLHLSDSLIFSLAIATNFYQSSQGSTFGSITNCDFDERGGLNVSAGALSLSACFFSIGQPDAVMANISGGSVTLSGCNGAMGVLPNGGIAILVNGADTQFAMTGGLYGSGSLDAGLVSGNGNCRMTIVGVGTNRNPDVTYTRATFSYANARGACIGNTSNTKGAGAGTFISVGNDTKVIVNGNQADGWSYAFPVGTVSNVQFGAGYVLGQGSVVVVPNGSGIASVAHNLPVRPSRFIVVAHGAGAFVHCQPVSADNTNLTFEVRSTTGVVTTSVTVDWVAFC